jgi:hypothetical protein
MVRGFPLLIAVLIALAMVLPAQAQIPTPQPNTCALPTPAFCETFDLEGGGGARNGDLPEYWGVSRFVGGGNNPGQGLYNAWGDTDLVGCSGTTRVFPPNDVQVCNGQLREASNDVGDVTVMAMYPKQPFDFAGRTGTIAFDVTNDTIGMHTSWPELWVTDQPVPVPFTHLVSWKATPRYGFGLRLGAATGPGQGGNLSPNCPSDNNSRWSVDSITVSRNYVIDDSTDAGHTTDVQRTGCVIASSGPNGAMNHIEVRVSENQVEVWATDAGSTALKQIAIVPNARLGFTRGLIWIQDAHYNAVKFGGTAMHTFTWDNVGFDGPVVARDVTFDEPDVLTPASGGRHNLGYMVQPNQQRVVNLPPLQGVGQAQAAYLLASWFTEQPPSTITYVVNGTAHTIPYPLPAEGWTPRTYAFPVPLGELHDGANTVTFGASGAMIVSNMGLVLAGVSGSGAPVPTATALPANTATTAPTSTLVATSTATVAPTSTAAPTNTTAPSTATPAATSTSAPTATPTPKATSTPTPVPPATATPLPPVAGTPVPGCYVAISTDGVHYQPGKRITNPQLARLICGNP